MAASIERLQRLTERQAEHRQALIVKLLKLLLGMWGDFSGWRDPSLVMGQAARSASLVDSSLAQSRLLTRTYLTSVLREMGQTDLRLPPRVDLYPRSGVSELDVYSRPATQYVYALSQGKTLDAARDLALQRLEAIATQDVKAADRDEAKTIYDAVAKVTGYRRIIHPELSKTGTCGLCLVASQRVYATDELMPLHGPSCNCTTLPIVKGDDPGFRINDDDLKAIYAAAGGSTYAEDLVNTRITINEHGELGPILTKQGDHFRDPEEVGRPKYVAPTPASIRTERDQERAQLSAQLDVAQKAYDAIRAADPDGQPPGGQDGLNMFRAIKAMNDRVQSIDRFLATLPQ